jgi:hypothetical protein
LALYWLLSEEFWTLPSRRAGDLRVVFELKGGDSGFFGWVIIHLARTHLVSGSSLGATTVPALAQ